MISRSIIVVGKVQGVYFRVHTREEAEKLGITGRVRNLSDGSVHILAEGSEEAMKAFLAWCAQGPLRARVDEVKVEDIDPLRFNDFSIVR
jgi:acylphosphatase